jgi:hypothetical protein
MKKCMQFFVISLILINFIGCQKRNMFFSKQHEGVLLDTRYDDSTKKKLYFNIFNDLLVLEDISKIHVIVNDTLIISGHYKDANGKILNQYAYIPLNFFNKRLKALVIFEYENGELWECKVDNFLYLDTLDKFIWLLFCPDNDIDKNVIVFSQKRKFL